MKLSKKTQSVLGCLATACVLPQAHAAQAPQVGAAAGDVFQWSVNAGAEYSDNIRRVAVDEESQTVGTAGLQLALNVNRPRLLSSVAANLQYKDYLDNAFDNEVVGGVDGSLDYALIPQRLHWIVEDNFGQVANNRQLADTPANRQNVNYLSTGPDIIFGRGRTFLEISGRYEDAYYETTPEDNQSLTGSVALGRRFSESASLALTGSTTEVEYDDEALFSKYQVDSAFLRFEGEGRRTTINADAGYTQVDREGGEKSDGPLFRLELSRAVAARSRIGLQAGTEFATPGEAFRRDQQVSGIPEGADDIVPASDPYQNDYAYLTWSTVWPRGTFTATLSARSEEHEVVTTQDRDTRSAAVTFARQITPRMKADLNAQYSEEELVNVDVDFDETNVGVGLSWLLGQGISLTLRLNHLEGSSNDGLRDYKENRAYLGIGYTRRRAL
ncbi:MAG TPA: outer membrane beta-barrel protein [Steroidobacteraceae bacterium]|nr:outer membrane beta-barrel protein [Steroidobacteraceae bacterium]